MRPSMDRVALTRYALAALGGARLDRLTRQQLELALAKTFPDVPAWRSQSVRLMLEWLEQDGYLQPVTQASGRRFVPPTWTVTAQGRDAIAAELTRLRKLREHAQRLAARRAHGSPHMRLWRLLRARGHLTAKEAAETLVDAGDDAAVERATRQAHQLLMRWQKLAPDAIQVGARRVDGHVRYVLAR
ncbi:hypothetical protein, partial [Piscinibacter sakaiensis]|uniref:hypothetical protein n=2 Tax=Piscinibacter sakaiensis TaxID=1547922 RepID=UPI00372D6025